MKQLKLEIILFKQIWNIPSIDGLIAELQLSEDIDKNVEEKLKWSGHFGRIYYGLLYKYIFSKSPFSLEPLQ